MTVLQIRPFESRMSDIGERKASSSQVKLDE